MCQDKRTREGCWSDLHIIERVFRRRSSPDIERECQLVVNTSTFKTNRPRHEDPCHGLRGSWWVRQVFFTVYHFIFRFDGERVQRLSDRWIEEAYLPSRLNRKVCCGDYGVVLSNTSRVLFGLLLSHL